MPVLFTMYRECRGDTIVSKCIEFIVKQFYVIHRKPFVLQFLGSVAHLVHIDNPLSQTVVTQEKVLSGHVVHVLLALILHNLNTFTAFTAKLCTKNALKFLIFQCLIPLILLIYNVLHTLLTGGVWIILNLRLVSALLSIRKVLHNLINKFSL